jgi:hypothetical protein
MDSNQRRTTPTVLQGDVLIGPELRLYPARGLLPRVSPAPNRTPSVIVVDDWTPNSSTRPSAPTMAAEPMSVAPPALRSLGLCWG